MSSGPPSKRWVRPVDVVCINAGVGVGGLFVDTEVDEELNMVQLNCASHRPPGQTCGSGNGGARHGPHPLHVIHCRRNGGPTRGGVRGNQGHSCSHWRRALRYGTQGHRGEGDGACSRDQPTLTSFTARAWTDTKVGTEGKNESQPQDVAKQGLDALFDGKDHVYAASLKDQGRRHARECDSRICQGLHA